MNEEVSKDRPVVEKNIMITWTVSMVMFLTVMLVTLLLCLLIDKNLKNRINANLKSPEELKKEKHYTDYVCSDQKALGRPSLPPPGFFDDLMKKAKSLAG